MSKKQFLDLIASGHYHALQKKDDRNREDIVIRREDCLPCEIENYPYRRNQMPAYIFDEFVRRGILKENGRDKFGGTIFRANEKMLKKPRRAA